MWRWGRGSCCQPGGWATTGGKSAPGSREGFTRRRREEKSGEIANLGRGFELPAQPWSKNNIHVVILPFFMRMGGWFVFANLRTWMQMVLKCIWLSAFLCSRNCNQSGSQVGKFSSRFCPRPQYTSCPPRLAPPNNNDGDDDNVDNDDIMLCLALHWIWDSRKCISTHLLKIS